MYNNICSRLETDGYVKRVIDEQDHRICHIFICGDRREEINEMVKQSMDFDRYTEEKFEFSELVTMYESFRKMSTFLEGWMNHRKNISNNLRED